MSGCAGCGRGSGTLVARSGCGGTGTLAAISRGCGGRNGMTLARMEAVVRGHLSANVTAGAVAKFGASCTSASAPGPAGALAWITGLVATTVLTIHAAAKVTVVTSTPTAATAPRPMTTWPPISRIRRRQSSKEKTRPSQRATSQTVAVVFGIIHATQTRLLTLTP